ncbi:binding protein [Theileria orientalis strain Shintoku]|uniref:Binding protein n=1 Tax=Theileria orientalis strain Shintoku TaxID=869250 RepID=J4DNT4_THEOR|nr:binding protein [Theileria orientalis strain Shintoku]PVC54018.1 binding protein [Theileria orientalis]BAM39514.1 binding protein [Theileria orientalis strain Shintoku]|eukprot:XP_009689815.1 binding protein [Theileria orientalis strain Shintoku]
MDNILDQFDLFFYRNIADSRFISGRTGALQSYGSSNLFIVIALLLIFIRLFHLITEYNSIWHIAKELQANPKAIHLSGMAEYAAEILGLYYSHFTQILRFKRKVKPIPIPRVHMPLALNPNSLSLVYENPQDAKKGYTNNLTVTFEFDCLKTTFVSAYWGVPLEIVQSAIIPKSYKKESFGLSLLHDTLLTKVKKLLRKFLIPFYTDQCELLLDQTSDMCDSTKISGDISLLCNEGNFCSSEPICFNSGSKIRCTLKPTLDHIEVDGNSISTWSALSSQEELLQKRIPLVIVLYTPRTQEPRVFSEGDVESHQGYAEITLVRFRIPNELIMPFVKSPKMSPKILKQVVFCGDYLCPQEPRDMFGMGDVRDKECLICIANEMDTVLLPCGHGSFCSKCLYGLRNDKCPVCRRNFYSYVKFPLKDEVA